MLNILIPTDFSENSYNALHYGMNLFADEECVFYLLFTCTPSIYNPESKKYSNFGIDESRKLNGIISLTRVVRRIKHSFPNEKHLFKKIVALNYLQDEIKRLVSTRTIDLIIMGTQGETNAAKVIFGSHTTNTIKEATRPLLAIPGKCKFDKIKNILFPSDLEADLTGRNLNIFKKIASRFNSNIHLLHVLKESSPDLQKERSLTVLADYFENNSVRIHLIKSETVQQEIFRFQEEKLLDFLVMLKHKHPFLYNVFNPPIENEIGFRLNTPLLVIPAENGEKAKSVSASL